MNIKATVVIICLTLILPITGIAKDTSNAEIWFVRHAEAGNNVVTRLTHEDNGFSYPLTAKGVKQANALAQELASVNVLKIYASARVRTIQTADAIAFSHALPIELAPQMVEVDLGARPGDKPYELWASVADEWENNPDFRYKNGETLTELRQRVAPFIEQLIQQHANDSGVVVVVAHGGSIRMGVLAQCDNRITIQSIKKPLLPNTGILKARVHNGKLICESFAGKPIAMQESKK